MRTRPLILSLALIGCLGLASLHAGGRSDSKVKVTAIPGKTDAAGNQVVTLTLDIEKGWHLYANPTKNEATADAATKITVKSGAKDGSVKVSYPEGHLNKDKVLGDFYVYENRVQIPVVLQRSGGPLEIAVRVNACDEKTCLPAATVKVSVP